MPDYIYLLLFHLDHYLTIKMFLNNNLAIGIKMKKFQIKLRDAVIMKQVLLLFIYTLNPSIKLLRHLHFGRRRYVNVLIHSHRL